MTRTGSFRRAIRWLLIGAALLIAALILVPSPIDPVAWSPPEDRGLTGAFEVNSALRGAEALTIAPYTGPEDAVIAPEGGLYIATHESALLYRAPSGDIRLLAETGGRPLGLALGPEGALYIADAFLGLLRWSDAAGLEVLAADMNGTPLRYANAVAVASDGSVYFTQSTQRFDPEALGGTLAASILDLAEHRETGRLLRWQPETGSLDEIATGFSFANGVALAADEASALVVETGAYRIWRVRLDGLEPGAKTVLIDNLPGFPDNISRAPEDDLFWVGIGSLRNPVADLLADWPSLRALAFKLPEALRPGPIQHGVIFAVDGAGIVQTTVQDPEGTLGFIAGARSDGTWLYATFLLGDALYRIESPFAEK